MRKIIRNKTKNTNLAKAFSLIELSIVILVIGILIAGITAGSRLYPKYKLQSARQLTQSSPVNGIKDLVVWLEPTMTSSFDAGDQIQYNTQIQKWNDINPQRVEKNHATNSNSTGPTIIENGIGGIPTLQFNGNASSTAGNYLDIADNTVLNSPNTFFVVSQLNDPTYVLQSIIGRMDSAVGPGTYVFRYFTDGTYTSTHVAGVNLISDSSGGGQNNLVKAQAPYIFSLFYQTGGIQNAFVNGSDKDHPGGYSVVGNFSNIVSPVRIGADPRNINGWALNGYISEVIIFSRVLTVEERQSIEKYLSKKYNIKI